MLIIHLVITLYQCCCLCLVIDSNFQCSSRVCVTMYRLMHVRNANCMYAEAELIWYEALQYVDTLEQRGFAVNRATLYSEYSTLLFARSQYEEVN